MSEGLRGGKRRDAVFVWQTFGARAVLAMPRRAADRQLAAGPPGGVSGRRVVVQDRWRLRTRTCSRAAARRASVAPWLESRIASSSRPPHLGRAHSGALRTDSNATSAKHRPAPLQTVSSSASLSGAGWREAIRAALKAGISWCAVRLLAGLLQAPADDAAALLAALADAAFAIGEALVRAVVVGGDVALVAAHGTARLVAFRVVRLDAAANCASAAPAASSGTASATAASSFAQWVGASIFALLRSGDVVGKM